MEITEGLGHGLIYFFTEIPLIGDAMAAFLAIVLIGTAFRGSHSAISVNITLPLPRRSRRGSGCLTRLRAEAQPISTRPGSPLPAASMISIAQMMEAEAPEALALRRTWEEYRETIVDPSAEVPPELGPARTLLPQSWVTGHRGLNWFANIFIAIGLLITFLGIIAALSTLDFSGDTAAMQDKLNSLMKVAGAKFWASVRRHRRFDCSALLRLSFQQTDQ